MLVLDETRLHRNRRGENYERTADAINRWTMDQLGSARVVDDAVLAPINPERQSGKLYPNCQRLEEELTRLSPNFVYEDLTNKNKRLFYALPDGTRDYICLYERGVTPEWSIMTASWTWVPDLDYQLGAKQIDRSALTAQPVSVQTAYDLIKTLGSQGAKAELLRIRTDNHDPDSRPGFVKILELGREAIRGWRSVLVRPLQKGYITLAQAKSAARRLGGTEERANWVRATGEQRVAATI